MSSVGTFGATVTSGVTTVSRMCFATSRVSDKSSLTKKIKSNRERIVGGKLTCSEIALYSSKRPNFGFAAARMEQRARKVARMPALAMLTVCCSIASCIAPLSFGSILSNSSMQAMPPSASTRAPASRVQPPSPNSSLIAAAVSPAPLVPLPLAYTPRGANSLATYCRISDLPTAGSPMSIM